MKHGVSDLLESRPGSSRRQRRAKADAREPLRVSQVGDLQLNSPDVVVVWDRICRRQARLGEIAIPLGDGGFTLVCQVQTANDRSEPPASVGDDRGSS
jgi:hypothetical protein